MEQTVKKKFGIRDIMTIAAMMVITFLVAMIIGSVTLPLWDAPESCDCVCGSD